MLQLVIILFNITSPAITTAVGYRALQTNISGIGNTAIGVEALNNPTVPIIQQLEKMPILIL